MKKGEIVYIVGVLRKTVQEKRKMNLNDVKEIVYKLNLLECDDLISVQNEVDIFIKGKVNYFKRKNNQLKILEYQKIQKRNIVFFEFFLSHKDRFILKSQ